MRMHLVSTLAVVAVCSGLSVTPRAASSFSITGAASGRRAWLSAAGIGTSALLTTPPARADDNDRRLGKRSAESIDKVIININRAEAPDYIQLPGMYPTIASKIVNHVRYEGSFNSLKEVYKIEGIEGNDKVIAVIKGYEKYLTVR